MVDRMTLILDAFHGSTMRLTLEEIVRSTSLPRSTAHRILDQLVKAAWLRHSPAGYALGRRSLRLGADAQSFFDLRAAAAPVLHDLLLKTGMVVHLAVLDDADVRYLDKVGGSFAAKVPSRVGGGAPAHSTALGKAMLAWLPAEEVDALVGGSMGRLTQRTISDPRILYQEMHRIRVRNGIAFERGEHTPGICCAAAAVRGPDGPLAAVSLVGGAECPLEAVAPLVAAAARTISLELVSQVESERADPAGAPAETWSADTLARLAAIGQDGDWI
ncbi:IclR family transcriptional regulator [Actinomadura verrucosospora]|uniref:IclR family transcriptional regulator n=2 Tax=Actinomadura verrucosospora TaxID=46165 RepID=A0A7D4A135_ACTVE|nr:IclR family transcriptional regulator [Actinomadura verrucosospora]